jgi:GTP-binding protein EngB required for normal cell division
MKKGSVTDLELTTMLTAAFCHDYEHPYVFHLLIYRGFNNVFLINKQDKLATRYNDKSVLENHHSAATFEIMKEDGYDIFSCLNKEDFKIVRRHIIEIIISTDMAFHM